MASSNKIGDNNLRSDIGEVKELPSNHIGEREKIKEAVQGNNQQRDSGSEPRKLPKKSAEENLQAEGKEVIVDGTNVIEHSKTPSLRNLDIVLEELKSRGFFDHVVFFDGDTRYDFGVEQKLPLEMKDSLSAKARKKQKSCPRLKERAESLQHVFKRNFNSDGEVEMLSEVEAIIWVNPEERIGRIIGKNGKFVKELEDSMNMSRIYIKHKKEYSSNYKIELEDVPKDAELYRDSWDEKKGWWRWIVRGEKTDYEETRLWEENGEKHLTVYDLTDEERKRYESILKTCRNMYEVIGTEADKRILDYAKTHPETLILSNDKFRDYEEEYSFLRGENRRIRFVITNGEAALTFPKA